MIEVEGQKYKVVENLGFNHDRGEYAKVVQTESGERVVVRPPDGKRWAFSVPQIRFTGPITGQ